MPSKMTNPLWSIRHPKTAARRLVKKFHRPPTPKKRGRNRWKFLKACLTSTEAEPTPSELGLKVAVAASPRLSTPLAWEWSQTVLAPDGWRAVKSQQVDLVLIEVSKGTIPGWDSEVTSELLEWSRAAAIPTVAWVCDATDSEPMVPPWLSLVDHIFVDDAKVKDAWLAQLPHRRVGVLEPAAQPRTHNPHSGGGPRRERAIGVVASEPVSNVLTAVSSVPANLVDVWAVDDETATALEVADAAKSLVPAGYASALSRAMKRYSVVGIAGVRGDTAWRIAEAASAHTCVVADRNHIARLPKNIGDQVVSTEKPDDLAHELAALLWQPELRDRTAQSLMRAVHSRHSYSHRVAEIADTVGLARRPSDRTVSAIVPTNRIHEIDNVLANISRQEHARDGGVELVLVLHGLDIRHAELQARAKAAGVDNITIVDAASELTLGTCMNLGVSASGGTYIAKMDDDNYYGRHYLTDLVSAFGYTEAGIVGKWAHYVWLKSTGAVLLRCPHAEHRYERLVQGGSMLIKRDVFRELRFGDLPRAVDTDLLNRAQEAGVATYSADRFNFVSIRSIDRTTHTWTIADSALMNRAAKVVFYGDPRKHVDV